MSSWRDMAACKGQTKLFFPDVHDRATYLAAVALCKQCPVIDECRTTAIDNDERYGIWGGLGADKRRRQKRLAERKSDETSEQLDARAVVESAVVLAELLNRLVDRDVNQLERFALAGLSKSELLLFGSRKGIAS